MATADSPSTQSTQALQRAWASKQERRRIHEALTTGTLTLTDIMNNPPQVLLNDPLIDIIRLRRGGGRKSAFNAAIETIGHRAMNDRVNLTVTLARASTRTRAWVAANGDYYAHNQKRAA